jgi:hypothetical protein
MTSLDIKNNREENYTIFEVLYDVAQPIFGMHPDIDICSSPEVSPPPVETTQSAWVQPFLSTFDEVIILC